MRPSERCAPYLKFENVGTTDEGPYEMVCIAGWKGLSKVNRPDGSYASGDHYRIVRNDDGSVRGYVYLGRGDDTLVHLNGEKTNPVPMEQSLKSSPLLRDCLVFGAGRPNTGALIIPYEHVWEELAGLGEEERQKELKKRVEPLLREVNAQCPSHSRLVPEMIRFLPPDTRFPVADKGSVKRTPANSMFAEEINQLYTEFDLGTSTSDDDKVLIESKEQLQELLKEILERFLGLKLDDKADIDLTSLGVDSVMDSQIRSQIHRSIRMPAPLQSTVVFQHPTLLRLTEAVYQHIKAGDGKGAVNSELEQQQEQKTYELLEEMRSKLKSRNPALLERVDDGRDGQVVVLTGATGSLGAHIVDQLRRKPTVSQIICLNRASNHQEASKRTQASLEARGLPPLLANDSTEVISLAAELDKPHLGLSPQQYDDIANKVTCVIHNGWPVNFNLSVDSFHNVLVGSVQLMNLAGQSTGCRTPRFLFSSSVSVALAYPGAVIPEVIFDDLDNTAKMGYAQSKWIVEQLCREAETKIGGGFQSVVMRIGQMVGDRKKGIWNETEAQPLLLKSAQTIGCLPNNADDLYWLPVDVAGLIAAQLTTAPLKKNCELVHVVSDEAMSWKIALQTLAQPQNLGNTFETVPYGQWLEKLEKSDQNPTRNPTIKLIGHFRAMKEAPKMGKFETRRLRELFKESALQKEVEEGLAAYKPEYLSATVDAWRKSGFLK